MNVKNNFVSIEQMVGNISKNQKAAALLDGTKKSAAENGLSFQEVLQKTEDAGCDTVSALKFSKHASERLESRNIALSGEQLERLNHGADKARKKGIQESLVMVDDLAFIVNVKNNTVVTAVNHSDSGVFTNIDGAVIG